MDHQEIFELSLLSESSTATCCALVTGSNDFLSPHKRPPLTDSALDSGVGTNCSNVTSWRLLNGTQIRH
jgi:hypothetical protein